MTSRAVRLTVKWDVSQWLATEPVTLMFGEGDTPEEALHDLFESLREMRKDLERDSERLTSRLEKQLAFLRAVPISSPP